MATCARVHSGLSSSQMLQSFALRPISRVLSTGAVALLLCIVVGWFTAQAHAEGARFLGNFSNVRMSSETGDCGGYSMQLFLKPGKARKRGLYGFVYDEESSCNGQAMRIVDGHFDTATGHIQFVVDLGDEGGWQSTRMRFEGTRTPRGLHLRFAYFDAVNGQWHPWSAADELQSVQRLERSR